MPELPAAEFEAAEISIEDELIDDVLADDADEVNAAADEEIASGEDEIVESLEERAARPTVRTLSDWMPANRDTEQDEIDELEETPGPSFDLPNVPLTPSNGSTVEFDPNMSFGPAAESEFELDDVDFDQFPTKSARTMKLSSTIRTWNRQQTLSMTMHRYSASPRTGRCRPRRFCCQGFHSGDGSEASFAR